MSIVPARRPAETMAEDVAANVSRRRSKADERKRELLVEARNARIAWVLEVDDDDSKHNTSTKVDDEICGGVDLLSNLRACQSDILPCAPLIVEAMLSSPSPAMAVRRLRLNRENQNDCVVGGDESIGVDELSTTYRRNRTVRRALDESKLEWEHVAISSGKDTGTDEALITDHLLTNVTPEPHPNDYSAFLEALCQPNAADVVLSCMKFCTTMKEAANVVVTSGVEDDHDNTDTGAAAGVVLTSLAKAIRGFVGKTIRVVEEHDAFHELSLPSSSSSMHADETSSSIVAKDKLAASIEKFVYRKCRRDIDAVLSRSTKVESSLGENTDNDEVRQRSVGVGSTSLSTTVGDTDKEFYEKVRSLEFVSPAHLEIGCLVKDVSSNMSGVSESPTYEDLDLSYVVRQIRSIHVRSSPREMLQSILMVHRGISIALNEACGGGGSIVPPGADDVLPTLILAILRSQSPHLPSALRLIEIFAQPAMFRGEVGYAYTSLCGAVQFLYQLDVDGHLKGVVGLGATGEMSAVLSIGPDEFRVGMDECRRKMLLEVEEREKRLSIHRSIVSNEKSGYEPDEDVPDDDFIDDDKLFQTEITARQVRDARSNGETVDMDWALRKHNDAILHQGQITDAAMNQTVDQLSTEEPIIPSQFSRSYSYLTVQPDNIGIRDLPKLLSEYKMLVHVTEVLLNERNVWKESERKLQSKKEREYMERDFADARIDENGIGVVIANGN